MKGKVVVIDFWFTGCIPCRAEMPYFDRLAETFKDRPVQFLSVSLDTGDQLMALWKKMVSEKDGKSPVLNLNLPGGFRSDFTARMNTVLFPAWYWWIRMDVSWMPMRNDLPIRS